jgi:hypothetical protein
MQSFYYRLAILLVVLLGLSRPALAQTTYTSDQLKVQVKQASDAARKHLIDSLAKVAAQQQAMAKTVQEAVKAALASEASSTHSEANIGTVSLVENSRYPLYSGKPATPVLGSYFKLSEMRFYLENGRLMRVYALGEVGIDSLYKQKQPDPAAATKAKSEALAARKAREKEKLARTAAATAKTKQSKAKTPKAKALLERDIARYSAEAEDYSVLALGAEARAKAAALDSVVQNLPLSTPDGPGIRTKHAYRIVRPVRFTNGSTIIDLNQAATDNTIDLLVPDEYFSPGSGISLRFLDLVSIVHESGRRLITDNATWVLKPGGTQTSHQLTAGASLGGLLEVALYTDLLATLNNEDNGLVTTEVSSFLPLNQRPLWRNGQLLAFTAVRPFVTLNRLDSKFDSLRLHADNRIDRPDLLQRSYLRFGLNLNLLTLDSRGHVTYHLNTSWTRSLTRVAGSTGRDTAQLRNVYQNLYGLEFLATIRRQRNFGADLYFTAYLHNVQSRRPIENTGAEWALRPGALFYYHPFGSPSNKLFFRVSNFIFPEGRQRDFVQLQVGYSIGIGNLLQGQSGGGPAGAEGTGSSTHLPSPQ